MMMSACEYIVMGVKGSKSVFNSDLATDSQILTDSEVIAVADKAATVIEQEIRKALSARGARPSIEEIRTIVEDTISTSAKTVSDRSINIFSKDEKTAALCVPNYVAFNSKAGSRLHPTEKPVPLLKYLTELFSNPGDVVLDPFAGSASMGEAAIATGRRAILVEKDKEFFDKGSARIKKMTDVNDSNQLILE
jgi:DNA modification methylase